MFLIETIINIENCIYSLFLVSFEMAVSLKSCQNWKELLFGESMMFLVHFTN